MSSVGEGKAILPWEYWWRKRLTKFIKPVRSVAFRSDAAYARLCYLDHVLFELRGVVQNALFGIRPLRRMVHRHLGSTGMNGDLESARKCLAGYLDHADVRGKSVLELGPGHTAQVLALAKEAGADRCVGLDVELVTEAPDDSRVQLLAYDGRHIPFPDQSFDITWSSDVLEHVRDPAQVLAECFRVLRPGGTLLAAIDLRDHYFLDREDKWLTCLKYPEPVWLALTSNRSSYVNRLRASEWRALFVETGFEVGSINEQTSDVLARLHAGGKIRRFGRTLTTQDASVYRVDVVLRRP